MNADANKEDFFNALFRDAEGIFETRIFKRNGEPPEQIYFDCINNLCQHDFAENRSVYFGCAPRATRGGKKENVGMVTALWCDLDYGEVGHKKPSAYMTDDEALTAVRERLQCQPSIIVDSGGGLHLYWLLRKPEPVDTPEQQQHVENIMRGVATLLGGDATHDISRVFRMPGTFNLKIPDNPRPCRIIHFEPDLRYDISDFNIPADTATRQRMKLLITPGQFSFDALPEWCKTLIQSGEANDYDNDRSRRDYAVIKSLVLHGATDMDIKSIFSKYAVGDKFRESNGKSYLRHTISKARKELEPPPHQHGKKDNSINPGAEAARILAEHKFKYACDDSFYMYGDGFWRRVNETYILAIIDRYLGEKAKRAHRSEVIEKLRVHGDVQLLPGCEMDSHRELINLDSGMLDISTGDVLPHDPDHLSTLRIQTPFVEGAACPGWLRFLSEVLPDKSQRAALQEFFGYTLTTDCRYEKSAILFGESGCNGKSVTLHILESMIGADNCTHEPWALLTEPFHIIRLRGRLLNVSAETPPNETTDTSLFKQLVSGDPISDSHKHRDRIDFRPFAKLAFACNTLPRIYDSSEAFFRRVLLFNFPISFQGREDRTLTDRLKQEMPGILNWAIEGLFRLRKNNQFTQSDESTEMVEQFRRQNNPVRTFVSEKCIVGDTLEVDKKMLFKTYKVFCGESDFRNLNTVHFFRELRKCVKVGNVKRQIDGKGKPVPCIIGLTLSGADDDDVE